MTMRATVKHLLLGPDTRRFRWLCGAIVVMLLLLLGLIFKPDLQTMLRPGETLRAEFAGNYELYTNQSKVKLDDLDVGVVSSIETTSGNTVIVTMKVDDGTLAKLGTAPTARIEPTTILGGVTAVNLASGGGPGSFPAGATIPVGRTTTPVEADRILQALPASARQGIQDSLANLNATLADGGGSALDNVLRDAPAPLVSGGQALAAARGTQPDDLSNLVTRADSVATVLSQQDTQLGQIVQLLDETTGTLRAQESPLTSTLATLPATLSATRQGLGDLGPALDKLTTTAPAFRPAAQQLAPLLGQLNPVLVRMRPLLSDLQPLMQDALPLVRQLVPTSQQATQVLNGVGGQALQRINGPITQDVLSPWHGTGPYQGGGSGWQADHTFYQELAYLASHFDSASKQFDKNGNFVNFHAGAGTASVWPGGTPLDSVPLLEQLLQTAGTSSGGSQ